MSLGQSYHRRLGFESLESRQMLSITVTTLEDQAYDGGDLAAETADDGHLSLREAIGVAVPGDIIDFDPSLTMNGPETIQLNVGTTNSDRHLLINKSLTIDGPGADLLTIRAYDPDADGTNDGDGSRVLNIDDGTSALIDVHITGLTLTNGDISGGGGAVSNKEQLSFVRSRIIANSTSDGAAGAPGADGGGIHSTGSLTILQCEIEDNVAGSGGMGIVPIGVPGGNGGSGGGVYSTGVLDIRHSYIGRNSSGNGGNAGGFIPIDIA
jgi:hypothetical protein